MLLPKLQKLTREKSPFAGANPPPKEANVRWLKPDLIAEIEFEGWTESGMIRQAAFKGLREDKNPDDVVEETPAMQRSAAKKTGSAASRTAPAASRAAPAARASKTSKGAAPASGPSTVFGVTISKPDKALWPNAGDG